MDNGACSYRRFLDGDDEGIAEIVKEYKDGLILFLNTYVRNLSAAEELAEDTFFRLIVKKPKFSGRSSFKSWLYAIGRNIAVDSLRQRRLFFESSAEESAKDPSDESDLERSYIKGERLKTVRSALSKIPNDYGRLLWLLYFEELSDEEAGVVMKKNPRQIRNLHYRAKKALKEKLEKEGFVYEEF